MDVRSVTILLAALPGRLRNISGSVFPGLPTRWILAGESRTNRAAGAVMTPPGGFDQRGAQPGLLGIVCSLAGASMLLRNLAARPGTFHP